MCVFFLWTSASLRVKVEGFTAGAHVLLAFFRIAKLNVLLFLEKNRRFSQWLIQGARIMENEMGEN